MRVHNYEEIAEDAYRLAESIWDFPRSLTGRGFNSSLDTIEDFIDLPINRISFSSGEPVGDWIIPQQWEVQNAFIVGPDGNKICDFSENNLHLVGYSSAFRGCLSRAELDRHLFSIPHLPEAIPYVTSYYKDFWGFCLQDSVRQNLKEGQYKVLIDTTKFDGELIVGECFIPGEEGQSEILLSTYLCHPSMANNELSGPVIASSLINIQKDLNYRRGLRVLFLPETIGSIAYLTRNLEHLKSKVIGGFVLTCVGDDREFSFLPTRLGNSLSDKAAIFELEKSNIIYRSISWLDRGSDERQFCAPGVDLPIASLMRSKYGNYEEYHTSLDKLGDVVTVKGIKGSLQVYNPIVARMRNSYIPKSIVLGEPFLSKHDLYPTTSTPSHTKDSISRYLLDIHSYCDGTNFVEDIANLVNLDTNSVTKLLKILKRIGVVVNV